jgi:hypothetical protein
MAAQIADDVQGCGSIDPTDPQNYSSVRIINDTATDVVIDRCIGTYCNPAVALPRRLTPGQSVTGDAACGASGAEMTSWEVRDETGATLGYIAVDSPRSVSGLAFHVRNASPNRATPTPSG